MDHIKDKWEIDLYELIHLKAFKVNKFNKIEPNIWHSNWRSGVAYGSKKSSSGTFQYDPWNMRFHMGTSVVTD